MGSRRSARIGAAGISLFTGIALVFHGIRGHGPSRRLHAEARSRRRARIRCAVRGPEPGSTPLTTPLRTRPSGAAAGHPRARSTTWRASACARLLPGGQGGHRRPGRWSTTTSSATSWSAAHRDGMRVVAWYLPLLAIWPPTSRMSVRSHDFHSDGQRFDGLALDIEWTQGVPDAGQRNTRLIAFTKRVRGSSARNAARRDRLPRGAARAAQPVPLAELPVPQARAVGRRLDADGVLDVPHRRLPGRVPLHRRQRPAAPDAAPRPPRRRPPDRRHRRQHDAGSTTSASCRRSGPTGRSAGPSTTTTPLPAAPGPACGPARAGGLTRPSTPPVAMSRPEALAGSAIGSLGLSIYGHSPAR